MKGRKKQPNELKKLRGTDQPCRLSNEDNIPRVNDLDEIVDTKKLRILKTKRAKDIFKEKANQLIKLKILTDLDFEQLAVYANSMDMLFDCIHEIKRQGKFTEVYNDEGKVIRYIENPNLKLYRDLVGITNKIAADFGFTPSARAKFNVPEKEEEDPLKDFING